MAERSDCQSENHKASRTDGLARMSDTASIEPTRRAMTTVGRIAKTTTKTAGVTASGPAHLRYG